MSDDTMNPVGRPDFVSYEVVRCEEPKDGKPARYHIYGLTTEGYKVSLDYLYLREHDNALKQAETALRGKTAESDRWYRLYCEQEKKIKELERALSVARSGV